jgi:hypothetical protein
MADNCGMRTAFLFAALAASAVGLAQGAVAQPKAPDAFSIVSKSLAEAAASGRNVWVKFDASW